MGEAAVGEAVRAVDVDDVPGESVAVIWRAAFDLLPTKEPAGDGWARWKLERGGRWFVCERQRGSDEHTARIAFVVDASMIVTWIAPLRSKARREEDGKLGRMLGMLVAALDAADEGFKAFEGALQTAEEDARWVSERYGSK